MWDWGHDKHKHIDILHVNSIGLASYLFDHNALVQRAKLQVKEGKYQFFIQTEFILNIEIPMAFEQLLTNHINHDVIFTRTKTV